MMPEMDAVVNWEHALLAMDGDAELLNSVIEAFLEEAPLLFAQIRQGLQQQQVLEVQRAAHTLKGTLGYFGNTSAAELAMQLEVMAQRNACGHAAELVDELERQLTRVLDCLTAHLGQRAA